MATFEDQVKNEYFEWLYKYVCKGRVNNNVSYIKLFTLLHDIEFTFYVYNDVNRARDGVDLRYRFAMKIDDERVMDILDGPCSVLEMLIALSIRCEETIMDDTSYGDRTGQWFWNMLSNLDISYMNDSLYNKEEAVEKIYNFLEKRYDPDGKGGLFYIKGCKYDLREEEIWIQLLWYLDNFA
jgi:hypothetical protein